MTLVESVTRTYNMRMPINDVRMPINGVNYHIYLSIPYLTTTVGAMISEIENSTCQSLVSVWTVELVEGTRGGWKLERKHDVLLSIYHRAVATPAMLLRCYHFHLTTLLPRPLQQVQFCNEASTSTSTSTPLPVFPTV